MIIRWADRRGQLEFMTAKAGQGLSFSLQKNTYVLYISCFSAENNEASDPQHAACLNVFLYAAQRGAHLVRFDLCRLEIMRLQYFVKRVAGWVGSHALIRPRRKGRHSNEHIAPHKGLVSNDQIRRKRAASLTLTGTTEDPKSPMQTIGQLLLYLFILDVRMKEKKEKR